MSGCKVKGKAGKAAKVINNAGGDFSDQKYHLL